MSVQFIVDGFVAGILYGLIGVGFGLVYTSGRVFHFAHAGVFTFGAYLVYAFTVACHWNAVVAVAFSLIGCALLGGLVEIAIYRPLRHSSAQPLALMLASLGVAIVLQNIVSVSFGDETKTIYVFDSRNMLAIAGVNLTPVRLLTVLLGPCVFLLVWVVLLRTQVGRTFRAVANDPGLAECLGISTSRINILSVVSGSVLAGFAATLSAWDTGLSASMGFHALLMGISAAIVGGIGSTPGTVLGGVTIGLAQHLGSWKLPTLWQDAIVFTVVILFLLLRPQGFFGKPLKKVEV